MAFQQLTFQGKTGEILGEDVELLFSANAKEKRVLRILPVEQLKSQNGIMCRV